MNGFFKPIPWKDGAIPLKRITSIEEAGKNEHGVDLCTVHLGPNVAPVKMLGSDADELMRRPLQIIPAEAGISFLHIDLAGDGAWREPVIAWALCMDGQVRPVCPGGVNDDVSDSQHAVYVEMPDKTVRAIGAYAEPPYAATVDELVAALKARAE